MALPKDFLWGYATASYQIEGAADEGGRQDSIWDSFCRKPGKIADGSDGSIACDSYHRYKDDVALLKQLGAKGYRFSVSWSRVIPLGGRGDPINPQGLQYYEDLVDELLANGITPMVTIFHWDLPQGLYDRYGGFLNKQEYVQDYANYARLLFSKLGAKVKYWITYNEPWCSSILGYNTGAFGEPAIFLDRAVDACGTAPGHTSDRTKSSVGDSSTEPWIVGHNILLAHAAAVKIYREEFKPTQHGIIGITLNGDWVEPFDSSSERDVEACERKLEFSIAWFADPIYKGQYPASMRQQLGSRLPEFSGEERELVQGSNDAYFMNTYTSDFIRARTETPDPSDFSGNVDMLKQNVHGESIGPETQSAWLRPHPVGFRRLLNWISNRYGKPPIYVTENGTSVKGENDLPVEQIVQDDFRAKYFQDYITEMANAHQQDGVDIRGYMAWSLLDNFEWAEGYETRFGVTYVDYNGGQKRLPKKSARVISERFASLCKS